MISNGNDPIWKLMGALFRPHPWHGLSIGEGSPEKVRAFIEIVPTDTMKYEIDKVSGYLKVDRPQRFSNVCPTLYGLVPQTYCARRVAEFCMQKSERSGIVGDGDPLDICVLAEKTINRGGIILNTIPIGGFRMIDGNEADDKIIAVMKDDAIYGNYKDISDCGISIVERLKHYFLTYKNIPREMKHNVEITDTYGRSEA
ncbi:MAG: inorganic pyrophosphatase, partial [Melioribacteraceae bacterium]|nr:inorganic pyrophosphatase [Melioribacteraceae bacterium]